MSTEQNNDPVHHIYVQGVRLAIWKKVSDKGKAFYTYKTQRAYKDEKGNVKYTDSFPMSMAQAERKAIDMAHTWSLAKQQEDFEAQKSDNGPQSDYPVEDEIPY